MYCPVVLTRFVCGCGCLRVSAPLSNHPFARSSAPFALASPLSACARLSASARARASTASTSSSSLSLPAPSCAPMPPS